MTGASRFAVGGAGVGRGDEPFGEGNDLGAGGEGCVKGSI
jgi:hypothetical protein